MNASESEAALFLFTFSSESDKKPGNGAGGFYGGKSCFYGATRGLSHRAKQR